MALGGRVVTLELTTSSGDVLTKWLLESPSWGITTSTNMSKKLSPGGKDPGDPDVPSTSPGLRGSPSATAAASYPAVTVMPPVELSNRCFIAVWISWVFVGPS